ncbi:hypothetical protein DPMN_024443 [Dreissena polymorpha]|uniref:Uncharacterized protein n=1 Tax=Dreissena polymorpha TaxID=45954 RepID=A0A9D4LPT2_DREPO|nr:hypothetical protein DPMN_024443 [Dreissena polymorpha]
MHRQMLYLPVFVHLKFFHRATDNLHFGLCSGLTVLFLGVQISARRFTTVNATCSGFVLAKWLDGVGVLLADDNYQDDDDDN